eukprot:CAMPEP_0184494270 /NCGR_PEP_ID=MMETSP0113_2-20130426/28296_1 /TAXON_ID=91329 /ORGANISM="Norrisiella sphaerica, Strain BC52" /LENGTH=462 /DNA_ID=CAMNT_0026879967 /DNA_START=98 /DNA_END=1483 /DNA_ORIENTATION=+
MAPLPILDAPSLLAFLEEHDFKQVHAHTIWHALVQKDLASLQELASVKNVPKRLVGLLQGHFALTTSKVCTVKHAKNGQTTKLLIEMQDGAKVETVIMHFGNEDAEVKAGGSSSSSFKASGEAKKHNTNKRSTLCVSSQVGCRMGCSFCATGTMGLRGHLLAGEILEQLYHARKHSLNPIRNVVFMGMGEPLDNFNSVLAAVQAMSDPRQFGLAPSRITVSTVGVIPYMRKLREKAPLVQLAISLHAPNQALREKIVPTATAYPLDKLMRALDDHLNDPQVKITHSRKVMLEYVVIKNVNDSDACARELVALLKPRVGVSKRQIILNLIPYNPTDVPENYEAPSRERVAAFHEIVRTSGILVTVRFEKGQDISGACGQLVVQEAKKNGSNVVDIEDIMAAGTEPRAKKQLLRRKKRSGERKTKRLETTDSNASSAGHVEGYTIQHYLFFWAYVAILAAALAW